MSWRHWLGIAVCLLVLGIFSNVAIAQDQDAAGQEAGEAEQAQPQPEGEAEETARGINRKFAGEITVTSSRREVDVREIPASVSVNDGRDLEAIGATTLDQYAQQVAGVNYIDSAPQQDVINIRGVATSSVGSNFTQPPVATYINEIPGTDYLRGIIGNFDVMPFDLERVEFLKGPQGTLYGSASLGGSIRFLVNRPNLNRNQGALHLTASSIASGGTGYLAQGMFNAVLAEGKFALRGVVAHQNESGFIDHASRGEDYNSFQLTNGRLIASWTPSDKVRLDATFMYQKSNLDATDDRVHSPDFDNPSSLEVWTEEDNQYLQKVGNLALYWDLGFADLMSSTTFMQKDFDFFWDYGPVQTTDQLLFQEVVMIYGFGLPLEFGDIIGHLDSYISPGTTDSESFFQEFRLVSKDTGRFDWIAGLFYADANTTSIQDYLMPGIEDRVNELAPGFGTLLYKDDCFLCWDSMPDARELALYGEVGIDLSETWKLTAGGRYTDFDRNDHDVARLGISVPGGELEIFENPTMKVFSPKLSLSFRPSSDLMWYGLVSRGYRTGGTNTTFLLAQPDPTNVPESIKYYDTDNLWNYETGVRKSWAGGNVTTDFTVFYLDWTDIQLDAQYIHEIGLINAVFNTGKAHSLGVEASVSAQLSRGLTFTTALMWNEAELDEDTPPLVNNETGEVVIVPAGSKLPASPAWSTATTLQYFWDSASWGYPFVALEHFYKDIYVTYMPTQGFVPSFNIFGLRVGATFANQLQLTLSVRNLLDERSATNFFPGGDGNVLPNVYPDTWWMTRPRTISLTIQKNF